MSDRDLAWFVKSAYSCVNLVKYNELNLGLPDGYKLLTVLFGHDLDGVRPFGIVVHKDTETIVAFRGTVSWSEWYTDAEIVLKPSPQAVGKVHGGFIDLYETLVDSEGSLAWRNALIGTSLTITGHSLGGALATYLALETGCSLLVTFGSPKCGDDKWSKYAEERLRNSKRYCSMFDPVPMLPISTFYCSFKHFCDSKTLTGPKNRISSPGDNHSLDRYIDLLPK
jgi:triacylglycerol lipase